MQNKNLENVCSPCTPHAFDVINQLFLCIGYKLDDEQVCLKLTLTSWRAIRVLVTMALCSEFRDFQELKGKTLIVYVAVVTTLVSSKRVPIVYCAREWYCYLYYITLRKLPLLNTIIVNDHKNNTLTRSFCRFSLT